MPTTPPRSGKSGGVRPPRRTAAVTGIPSANSGHCSAIPGTVAPLWEPAAPCTRRAPHYSHRCAAYFYTFPTVEPTIGTSAILERGPSLDQSKTPDRRTLGAPPRRARRTVPSTPIATTPAGAARTPARSTQGQDATQDNRTPGAMISRAPQCTFYSSCSLCAPDSGRKRRLLPPSRTCTPPLLVSIKGEAGSIFSILSRLHALIRLTP